VVVYLATTLFFTDVPVEKVRKSVNIWRRYGKKMAANFFVPPCMTYELKLIQQAQHHYKCDNYLQLLNGSNTVQN